MHLTGPFFHTGDLRQGRGGLGEPDMIPGTLALQDPSEEQAQPPSGMLRLQQRLKEAARRIQRLRLEKEQLLELGNKLRAQRGSTAGERAWPPFSHSLLPPHTRASGLGQLQGCGWGPCWRTENRASVVRRQPGVTGTDRPYPRRARPLAAFVREPPQVGQASPFSAALWGSRGCVFPGAGWAAEIKEQCPQDPDTATSSARGRPESSWAQAEGPMGTVPAGNCCRVEGPTSGGPHMPALMSSGTRVQAQV